MTQQPQYDLQQIAFTFSLVSNAAAGAKPGVEFTEAVRDSFAAVTASQYQAYLGAPWTLGWGPAVFENDDSTTADNTLLVAKGQDASGNPIYIVAMAGTNPNSAFDKQVEDLEVGNTVPFSGPAWISQGTSTGLGKLEALTSNGETIQQYLQSVASTKATLIFTGHSLGGALAPTLALDLFVNKGMTLGKWGAVYVLPTAGPTPGNQAFVDLFKKTFPATNGWNQNYVNTIDVVPHAWYDLDSIPSMYTPNISVSPCISGIVNLLRIRRGLNAYTPLPQAPFTGTYNASAAPPAPYDTDPACQFLAQALYQHIAQYMEHYVPEVASLFFIGAIGNPYPQLQQTCSTIAA